MRELSEQFFPTCLGIFEQYKDGEWLGELEKRMIRERKIPDEVTSKTLRTSLQKLAFDLNIELQ